MTLYVYNTLTRKKEEFKPIVANKVGMYVCGVTVYDSSHLGHARAALSFDMIARYLRFAGFEVNYVTNFTDVDDKIIARANQEKVSSEVIAERYIAEYNRDMASLGILPPTQLPKATQHISEMIALIEKLIARQAAYAVNGSVYFSVRAFPEYGKLSGKKIEDLEVGSRIEVDEAKKDPLDFVLWKPAKAGDPAWESPWGKGRPGWHIECSAMSCKFLGETFDIHGGGRDIQFPHHENEIAQSEAAHGKTFAHYWLHNGMITMNGEKMSKSLGNVANIVDLVKKYDAEAIRFFVFSNHYRSPLDYTEAGMRDAESALERYYSTQERINASPAGDGAKSAVYTELKEKSEKIETIFRECMSDDFNTASFFGQVFEWVRLANRYLDEAKAAPSWLQLSAKSLSSFSGKVLGVFGAEPKEYLIKTQAARSAKSGIDSAQVEALIAERLTARANKDFARSDQIRDQLKTMGVEIKDLPGGKTEWKLF